MRFVHKSDVWEWLRDSENYKNFFEYEDVIVVEDENYSETDEVNNFEEFVNVYRTIGFWGVKNIPFSIYLFYEDNKHEVLKYLYDIDNAQSRMMVEDLTGYFFSFEVEIQVTNDIYISIDIHLDNKYLGEIELFYGDTEEFDESENESKIYFGNLYNKISNYVQLKDKFNHFINSIKTKTNSLELTGTIYGETIVLKIVNQELFCEMVNFRGNFTLFRLDTDDEKKFVNLFENLSEELSENLLHFIGKLNRKLQKGKSIVFNFKRDDLIKEINLFLKKLKNLNWDFQYYNFKLYCENLLISFDKHNSNQI